MKANPTFLKNDFPFLLVALTEAHQPLWGKMSAQHMVEHLNSVLDISNGNLQLEVLLPPEQVERAKRHAFIYKNPFPKNLRTPILPEDPGPVVNESMEKAKEELRQNLTKFFDHFKDDEEKTENHPLLGPLNFAEWVFFQTKHISHHLCQFGLLKEEVLAN